MQRTLIIAEIGECYNGNMETAYKLMDAAKSAGCDIVKFQTLDDKAIDDNDPERDWFYKIAMNPERIRTLCEYAGKIGIEILFTPQDERTATWALDNGLTSIKIASNAIGNTTLLKFAAQNFKRVFVSTGMASLDEVIQTVELFKNNDLWIMHCVSEYPTGPLLEKNGLSALAHDNVRLNMMPILKSLFPQCKVGYSDHTRDILACVTAVAMGADVIEKHITLDRKTPIYNFTHGLEYLGTDHFLSLEPPELEELVRQIRAVEIIKGEWEWRRSDGELILRDFIRERFR